MKKHGTQLAFWISYAVGVIIGVLIAQSAHAAVLSANSIDGAPIVTYPGGSFAVNITSETPLTTGIAYLMVASQPGILSITGRDTSLSSFTILDAPDADSETQLGILGDAALLDPANSVDLGADVLGGDTVIGPQHVARLTFRVAEDATPGQYTLTPTDDFLDGGWYGPGPDFERFPFDMLNGVSFAVTPEPPLLLACVAMLLLLRKTRRTQAV